MTRHQRTSRRQVTLSMGLSLVAVILLAPTSNRAQEFPSAGGASDFNSVEYYSEAPHQQQIKRWLSGAEAQSLPGGLLLVKQVKIETFNVDGKLQLIAKAPECVYDPINGVASSPGEVHMQTGDGQLRVNGKGFLWRQSDSFLTISNNVETTLEAKTAAIEQ
jgi:hypothetical protein